MPELPEVEVARKSIERSVVGRTITAVEVLRPTVLRQIALKQFPLTLAHKRVRGLVRRGKALVFDLSSDWVLVFRFMLWGLLRLSRKPVAADPRTAAVIQFSGGVWLAFRELQLSTLTLYEAREFRRDPFFQKLGIDPLASSFDQGQVAALCRSAGSVRATLTNQERIAGIGNLWAHEILHAARLHPARAGSSLSEAERRGLFRAIQRVLRTAIRRGGEPEFFDAHGRRGRYRLAVYGRGGQRCPRGDGTIHVGRQEGRPSFYCPVCQR